MQKTAPTSGLRRKRVARGKYVHPADLLRRDLEALSSQVRDALVRCDALLGDERTRRRIDAQRDVLHLRVRIEVLARQIEDAAGTLERICAWDELLPRTEPA